MSCLMPVLRDANEVVRSNFNFTEDFYKQFQDFINSNAGKTTRELCEVITFYSFTEKTLDEAFKLFNTYKNTYYRVCGPFIYKNNRWYPSENHSDTFVLLQENVRLRALLAIKNEENSST